MFAEIHPLPLAVLTGARLLITLAMLLAGYRIWRGPSAADRIVALDLLGSLLMAQFVLLVFRSGFVPYLNVAAAIAVIGFLATVAFARYLQDNEEDA